MADSIRGLSHPSRPASPLPSGKNHMPLRYSHSFPTELRDAESNENAAEDSAWHRTAIWRRYSRFSLDETVRPQEDSDDGEDEKTKPDENLKRLKFKDHHRLFLGVLIICGIAVSSSLLNYYAKNTSTTYFHAPLFLIWFRSNWRIAAFPIFVFLKKICLFVFQKWVKKDHSVKDLILNGTKIYGGKKITARIFFIDIAFLSTISIGVQYLTFAPYHFVSAGTGTALNATNVAWAYLLSVLMLGVDIMPVKIVAVLFSLSGAVMLAYHEGFSNPDWESILMIICGAMIAALYQVLYKKRIGGTTDLGQITFSVSALAAFTLVTMWPIVLALYITKAERWQWESIPWDIICKNSAASMAFNYLINLGVAWTNPVFTSLGFLLAVPLAHFYDASLAGKEFDSMETVGTVMIGVGFLVIVFADRFSTENLRSFWNKIHSHHSCLSFIHKLVSQKNTVVTVDPTGSAASPAVISMAVDGASENEDVSAKNHESSV